VGTTLEELQHDEEGRWVVHSQHDAKENHDAKRGRLREVKRREAVWHVWIRWDQVKGKRWGAKGLSDGKLKQDLIQVF